MSLTDLGSWAYAGAGFISALLWLRASRSNIEPKDSSKRNSFAATMSAATIFFAFYDSPIVIMQRAALAIGGIISLIVLLSVLFPGIYAALFDRDFYLTKK